MKQPLRITPQVQIVDPSGRTTRDGFNLFQGILDQLSTDSGPIGTALQPSDIGVTVQAHSSILDATTAAYTAAKDTKLAGIAPGATANSSDAFLLARANHTGTQLAATISDFSTAADARVSAAIGVTVQAYSANLTAWAAVNPSSYLTTAAAAAAYQPLDADLTSWASVTRAAGYDTFAATPSSANLAALVTGETGSGALVFATSPALVTPALGTPSALVLTNATGTPSAIGLANGTGLPVSTGISGLGAGIAAFLATPSSANLATAVTDESGTGILPFLLAGTFTPTVAFATPGTSSFAYATQEGRYLKVGTLAFVRFRIVFTPTIGTGSGPFSITGMPAGLISSNALGFDPGGGTIGNITSAFTWPAGATSISFGVTPNSTSITIKASGSAINMAQFTQANLTGGSAHTIVGLVIYETA